jgi:hypothetical protein
MNRLCHAISDLKTLIAAQPHPRPAEALLVPADGLVRVLERELAELHEHRRRAAGTPAQAAVLRAIACWQEVLAWIKPFREAELVLTVRRTAPPTARSIRQRRHP